MTKTKVVHSINILGLEGQNAGELLGQLVRLYRRYKTLTFTVDLGIDPYNNITRNPVILVEAVESSKRIKKSIKQKKSAS